MEHWFERYELFYGLVRVGVINGQGGACGFPPFWTGLIEYDADLWTTDAASHLAGYLRLVREAARLLDTGGDGSQIRAQLRAAYMDVVESTEWKLIDSRGTTIPIHCPSHHQNDVVSWVRIDGRNWC